MKIGVKTSLWETKNLEEMKAKYKEEAQYLLITSIAAIATAAIYEWRTTGYLVGGLFLIRSTLTLYSYKKYKQGKKNEQQKENTM